MKYIPGFLTGICILFCFSCQKTDTQQKTASPEVLQLLEEKLDLNKSILSSPPPRLSAASTIDIVFSEPVVPDHMTGSVLDKNPFSFKPQINGKAQWISRTLLRFTPDSYMPAGEKIEGMLNGKTAFGRQKNVNDYSFSFQVAEQEIMDISGRFAPKKGQKNTAVYKAVLSFAQPVDIKMLEKDLSVRGDSRLSFRFDTGDSPSKVELALEPIIRTDRPKRFQLRLPGKYTASRSEWTHDVILAAADDFHIMAHQDITEPDGMTRIYGFKFSEPVDPDKDISGYVSVSPRVNYQTGVQSNYLTVRGDFLPGQAYTIEIEKGLPSVYGISLKEKYSGRFYFENIKPEVQWLNEGIYLPPGNTFKLQFKSVNIRRIQITVTEIMPQNLGFFLQNNSLIDNAANWTSQYSYFEYHDIYRTGKTIHEGWEDITDEINKWIKTELDLSPVFKGKTSSAFIVSLNFGKDDLTGSPVNDFSSVRDGDLYFQGDNFYTNPASYGYYYSKGTLNKMLIASETGLTIKKENQGFHVFAANTSTALPVSELKLDLYSRLNEVLETRTTNRDGHTRFENDGAYILGKTSSGIALLKLDNKAWETQKFDISGSLGSLDGINVFMYADRGVHRPGDTIYLSAIIRSEGETLPAAQPVILTVHNPLGQEMLSTKTEAGFNGHVGFPVETRLSDPAGDWIARMDIGGRQFSKVLKVETIRPNRLKIDLELPAVIREETPRIKGRLNVRHLFGAQASNLNGKIEASFDPVPFGVERYSDFIFTSPLQYYQPRSVTLWDGELDSDGQTDFDAAVPESSSIPGALRASLLTTIYERGGIPAEHRTNLTIFPYTAYAGVKDIFDYGYTAAGQSVSIPVVVVNAEGEPLAGQTVKINHYYNSQHWWYDYDQYDRRDFRTESSTLLIEEKRLTSALNPVEAQLNIDDQGQHYIEIEETVSGHRTGLFFYASRWGDTAKGRESRERNTLEISADQNVYQTGDKAVLSFDSPSKGMALLTLEQGERVIHKEWKPLTEGITSFTFTVTNQMMPNCYASISMIQPHNQNTNDAPMRVYGIKPLYVKNNNTRLKMNVSAPDQLRPKEKFSVRITSGAPEKVSYTLAVVDEGLLDLTAFRTPSPWDHFFRKIRLAVRTMDNYDEILGTLFPDINKLITIGGGLEALNEEMGKRLDQSKVRRFEPVVIFKGPISIEPGQTVETEMHMPNYVGSVRVMVIGASGHSYVSLEKTIPVTQPLMILPTIPRVIRPGDKFELPVSVFAMDSLVQNVKTALAVSSNLEILNAAEHQIIFEKPEEKDISFLLEAGKRIGADTIRVKAVSGQNSADYTVHLPVNSVNPFYTDVLDTTASEDKPLVLIPEKFGLEGTNRARIAFSRMPDIQMDKRVRELIRYPYGCLEQIISALIPQIILPNLAGLSNQEKQAITANINTGISELQRFKYNTGFSYWPQSQEHQGNYADWASAYLGQLLLEAKNAGYYVPPSLYNHWLSDTRQQAGKLNTKNYRYQTYRLYLLALAGSPESGAMNMLRENHAIQMDPLSRLLLAAAYYHSGQRQAAEQLKRAASAEINPYRETGGTFGSELRDLTFIALLNMQTDDHQAAGRLLNQAVNIYRSRNWHSTQETAFMIMAMSAWHKIAPFASEAVTYTVNIEGRGSETYTLETYQSILNLEEAWGKKITVTSRGRAPLYVSLMTEGVPLKSRIQAGQKGLTLARNFYDDDGSPITVDIREQGASFWIVYTVNSGFGEPIENLALSSALPAGWEIMSTRLFNDLLPQWLVSQRLDEASYTDIRDDRINWFFDLHGTQSVRFAVKINPTFKGEFSLPPVVAESMYSPDFYARTAGGKVTVR